MKTRTTFILFLTAILTLAAGSTLAYSGGTGEPNTPYQIATKADLLALAADTNDYNQCFILTADIDMQGQVFTTAIIAPNTDNSNYDFEGIAFTGTFDGNGHKITNFTINGASNWFLGLFGGIFFPGSVENLGLENCSVSGYAYVSGLVGYNDGIISNCYSTCSVSGGSSSSCVGGLVGFGIAGSISNCYSTGSVSSGSSSYFVGGLVGNGGGISNCHSMGTVSVGSGSSYVGGLVGGLSGSLNNCYSTGSVSSSTGTSIYIGGLVGYYKNESGGTISNCYSTGSVSGGSNSSYVGGLVGYNDAFINNCCSTGSVSGYYGVGGLVGYHVYGIISNCYSTGLVSGYERVGGLMGANVYDSIISSSFWDTDTSGQTTSDGGTGMTTAQMQTLSTFTSAGWDFTNETANGTNDYWRMCVDGVNYPQLNWQYAQYGDFACPDGVDFSDFAYFAGRWHTAGCNSSNNFCGGADIDSSGKVDMQDLEIFAANWLSGE